VSLREETVKHVKTGTDAVSWRKALWEWQDYIEDSQETAAVFENEYGDRVRGGDANRFMEGYSKKQYAKLKDLERGVRGEYGKRLHTGMLTLTASSTREDGTPLPPVDHLDGLLSSWEAVRRELSRSLEGRRWEYLAILEPHKSGYIHVHVAVFVDGVVRREDFAPVIDAHLRNCSLAGEDAHDVTDDSTISVKHVGAERSEDTIGNLGTYLAEYLGTYSGEALHGPEYQQMANAILWATGRQRWRPSQGAQSYMATNRSEDDESTWEFVGIEDGAGEFHKCGGGRVTRVDTWSMSEPPPGD
jgi:hypothetical protein